MPRIHAPTTEDIDNFAFAASKRISDLLRGELDLDSDFTGDFAETEHDFVLPA